MHGIDCIKETNYIFSTSMCLCYDVSVRLSMTEVHCRIIANLGFKFRIYCALRLRCMRAWEKGSSPGRVEDHLALC